MSNKNQEELNIISKKQRENDGKILTTKNQDLSDNFSLSNEEKIILNEEPPKKMIFMNNQKHFL